MVVWSVCSYAFRIVILACNFTRHKIGLQVAITGHFQRIYKVLRGNVPNANHDLFSVVETAMLSSYSERTLRRMIQTNRVKVKTGRSLGNKKAYWFDLKEINRIRATRFHPPLELKAAYDAIGVYFGEIETK
jgi:hypothetical protein